MKQILLSLLLVLFTFDRVSAQTLAFPSAEGGGKYASGGRGGQVIYVTNLNDSGSGSLREAIETKGTRTILFAVDGTIELRSKLIVEEGNLTIAGHSAPGDGICLKGFPFYIQADNVIVRYLRFRLGDLNAIEDDAAGARKTERVIIDHCSFSWSVDECASFYQNRNFTMQWCIISNSLAKSSHSKGTHGFGGIWGGENASFHHNLIAHHTSRNPRFASDGYSPVDFRNNVVYNWGFKAAYGGGRQGRINFVANYYKPGPATTPQKRSVFLDGSEDKTSRFYLSDNQMEGSNSVTQDNWGGVHLNITDSIRSEDPFPVTPIIEQRADLALNSVLKWAGASLHRDEVDKRVVKSVRNNKPTFGKRLDNNRYSGIIDSQSEMGGWPVLRVGKPSKDSDGDGIPDRWEIKNGLNPSDSTDANGLSVEGYTYLECYLSDIIKEKIV